MLSVHLWTSYRFLKEPGPAFQVSFLCVVLLLPHVGAVLQSSQMAFSMTTIDELPSAEAHIDVLVAVTRTPTFAAGAVC